MRRWLEVAAVDRALLVGAGLALLVARFALRVVPVRRLVAWQQRPVRERGSAEQRERQRRRVRWAVEAVARRSPIVFVCFPQCLAASFLLRVSGVRSRLHYGVAREQGRLATHTWLESGGAVLIGGDAKDGYSTLAVY